jgi:hypothetical protein
MLVLAVLGVSRFITTHIASAAVYQGKQVFWLNAAQNQGSFLAGHQHHSVHMSLLSRRSQKGVRITHIAFVWA